MCGKLQCENVKTLPVFGIKPAIIQTPIKGNSCWGVDFQLGSDVPDPGMVNEGTKCAPGKVQRKRPPCGSHSVLRSLRARSPGAQRSTPPFHQGATSAPVIDELSSSNSSSLPCQGRCTRGAHAASSQGWGWGSPRWHLMVRELRYPYPRQAFAV